MQKSENNQPVQMLTDIEAYNVCLKISSQLMTLTSSNLRVQDKINLFNIIDSELEFLNNHYQGSALNNLLANIVVQFNKVGQEASRNLKDYKNLYTDPSQPGQDGFC